MHPGFERLCAQGSPWSLDAVGLDLFTMIAPSLPGVVMPGLDDALVVLRFADEGHRPGFQ